jgi:hypothetical protein
MYYHRKQRLMAEIWDFLLNKYRTKINKKKSFRINISTLFRPFPLIVNLTSTDMLPFLKKAAKEVGYNVVEVHNRSMYYTVVMTGFTREKVYWQFNPI